MYKVGLVGLGMAGIRFVRCLDYLNKTNRILVLDGVYDIDSSNYHLLENTVNRFFSLEDFINYNKFDIIIITVNEADHFDVLKKLKTESSCKKYIIEKPICTSFSEYNVLKEIFSEDEIIVHYVERYSKAVSSLKNWLCETNFQILRIGFTWGKMRLYDSRPTIGILSELVHPLDLCSYLINDPLLQIHKINSQIIASNFSISGKSVPDMISLSLQLKNHILITGESSFLLSGRRRELTIFASDINDENNTYVICMFFDNPRWDVDGYEIYKVNINGTRELIKTFMTENDATRDTLCITKSINFLSLVCEEMESGLTNSTLHHLKDSYFLQEVAQNILISSTIIDNNTFSEKKDVSYHNTLIEEYTNSWKGKNFKGILDTGY